MDLIQSNSSNHPRIHPSICLSILSIYFSIYLSTYRNTVGFNQPKCYLDVSENEIHPQNVDFMQKFDTRSDFRVSYFQTGPLSLLFMNTTEMQLIYFRGILKIYYRTEFGDNTCFDGKKRVCLEMVHLRALQLPTISFFPNA